MSREQVIRDWVVERVTLIADNNERWYTALREAAQDGHSKGDAVAATLRILIRSDSTTARELLMDLLDLDDEIQAGTLTEHYGEE
jgi:hypothetical protein